MKTLRRVMANTLGLLAVAAMSVMLVPVLLPTLVPGPGNEAAFSQVVTFHTFNRAPRRHEQRPLIYLSWFPHGHPRSACDYAAYADGTFGERRLLWDEAIQGGGGRITDAAAVQAFARIESLPPGLSGPTAVPCGRVLIVSGGKKWQTRYYDRQHLPPLIQRIIDLATVKLSGC